MSNEWEDDDFFDDEESPDFGEETAPHTSAQIPVQNSVLKFQPEISKPNPDRRKLSENKKQKQPRRIRVKVMSPSMQSRWPDVVSCLLTLHSGKQVMFVKGEG